MSHKCSICHQPGHNSRTCPKNRASSPISIPDSQEQNIEEIDSFDTAAASPISTIPETQEEVPDNTSPSKNSSTIPPEASILAEEIAADLEADQDLLEAVMDFSLNSTDDGKDEDYHPSSSSPKGTSDDNSGSNAARKKPIKTPLNSKNMQAADPKSGPPARAFNNASASIPPASSSDKTPKHNPVQPHAQIYPGSYKSHSKIPLKPPPLADISGSIPRPRVPFRRHPRAQPRNNSQPPPSLRQPLGQFSNNLPYDWRNSYIPPTPRNFPPHSNSSNMNARPNMNDRYRPPHRQMNHAYLPRSYPYQPFPIWQQDPSFHQPYQRNFQHRDPSYWPHQYAPYPHLQHPLQPHPPQNWHNDNNNPHPPRPRTNLNDAPKDQHPSANHDTNVSTPAHSSSPPNPPIADASASSNPSLDTGTGIIRPNPEALLRMQNLGLKIAYAVAWRGGGGVFLFKQEAESSRSTASAVNSKPTQIKTFAVPSCNLTQIEALAVSWTMEQKASLESASASPSRPAASSSSSPTPGNNPPPPPSSPASNSNSPAVDQAHSSPSPQQSTRSPPPANTPQSSTTSPTTPTPTSHPVPPVSTPTNQRVSLISADEWSFSQEDILVKKCLLSPRFAPISIKDGTPDPNKLPYIAAPGSSKGLILSGADSGLQNMLIDPNTGTISLKPRHLPTLRLLDFPTFLSLMFRAVDTATGQNSIIGDRAAEAIRTLLRDLTRTYESLQWAKESAKTWPFIAFLRFTHMIQSRTLLTGFNCEQAFLSEARNRCRSQRSNSSIHSNASHTSPLIHAPSKITNNPPGTTSTQDSYKDSKASHWFICPCCGSQNDHFSPNCPSQAKGRKPIPKYIQEATKLAINGAPITTSARNNLLRMATALYAKLEKPL